MNNRREFIKKAAFLSGGLGLLNEVPASIQKAMMIDPAPGSTYLDAEHIVFLMQENRSFDHCFGALQGVRGFNDPRAINLPNQNKVWAQTNNAGETYTPFHLNLKDSRITWLGSLPHSWNDMTEARNQGHHDRWLEAKKSGRKECAGMPLTMGYFDRRDIPFYYALADAFTVCDHHFCSSLTGTTPNRLHFWTGTIREKQDVDAMPMVYNSDVDYGREASWKTFPEILEDNQISWRIYQNEVSVDSGFEGEEEDWLANFTDNPIEWFKQFQVRFAKGHRTYLKKAVVAIPEKIEKLNAQINQTSADDKEMPRLKRQLDNLEKALAYAQEAVKVYTDENYERLSARDKSLHERAFSDNRNDPNYRQLETVQYDDNGTTREMQVPKGDILHQFRQDVVNGQLPTVSWVVAPSNFSDHPGSPWYGAWYLSEVIDILTQNPEIWKKTIFILNYDENDGYFDHMPPFVPADPYRENSGKMSAGIDAKTEWVSQQQAWAKQGEERLKGRLDGPVGLGFRVPMIVASPWSRGGYVNSEVFDLTSPIQFMEHFLSHKTGKKIKTDNITAFRRAVCGDMRSIFRPYNGEPVKAPSPVERQSFFTSIHKAQFKDLPSGFQQLSASQLKQLNENPTASPLMPKQEKGTRPANAVPYHFSVDCRRRENQVQIQFNNSRDLFGDQTSGAAFMVFDTTSTAAPRNYVVAAGDQLIDQWNINETGQYLLRVHGANGFFREFAGHKNEPELDVECHYETGNSKKDITGNLLIKLHNRSNRTLDIEIIDRSYGARPISRRIAAGKTITLPYNLAESNQWYDCSVRLAGNNSFERRYAGHVETGRESITDPLMGGMRGS